MLGKRFTLTRECPHLKMEIWAPLVEAGCNCFGRRRVLLEDRVIGQSPVWGWNEMFVGTDYCADVRVPDASLALLYWLCATPALET